MASVTERAAIGQRAAMISLYDKNKRKVFAVANALLCDSAKAEPIVAEAFRASLATVTASGISSENAFSALVLHHAVELCKKQLVRQNPKALRLPSDRRFLPPDRINTVGAPLQTVLTNLPELQRLILVLHTISGMTDDQVASAAKLDKRTLQTALDSQEQNITRMLSTANLTDSYDDVIRALKQQETAVSVPSTVDEQVEKDIKAIAAPFEAKRKKRRLTAVLVTLGICVLLVAFSALLIWDMIHSDAITSDDTADGTSDLSVGTVTSVDATHYAEISVKDYGTITVALDADTAPATVENFKALADSGFYDGLTFHRIIEDFMMQGGDPNGDGSGGSENNVVGEFADNGYDNPLSHVRGAISMARSTDYDSGSSQFFIVHEDSTYLDGQYAAFGYVTDGMDIVDAICESAEPTDSNGTIEAADQPIIESLVVYEAD